MKTKFASVAAVAALLLITGLSVKKYDTREAAGEIPGFDYFYAQRAYPYGKIDYEALRPLAYLPYDYFSIGERIYHYGQSKET